MRKSLAGPLNPIRILVGGPSWWLTWKLCGTEVGNPVNGSGSPWIYDITWETGQKWRHSRLPRPHRGRNETTMSMLQRIFGSSSKEKDKSGSETQVSAMGNCTLFHHAPRAEYSPSPSTDVQELECRSDGDHCTSSISSPGEPNWGFRVEFWAPPLFSQTIYDNKNRQHISLMIRVTMIRMADVWNTHWFASVRHTHTLQLVLRDHCVCATKTGGTVPRWSVSEGSLGVFCSLV